MSLIQASAQKLQQMFRKQAQSSADNVAKAVKGQADEVAKAIKGQADDVAKKAVASFGDDAVKISGAARKLAIGDDLSKLNFKRAAQQGGLDGGHLPKQIMEDQFGRKWMFKTVPAGEEFRALGDKVGGDILEAVGIRTPKVHTTTQLLGGKERFGTIQQLVEHSGKTLSEDVTQLTQQQLDELVESHVGRWLISDHDGKVANFLVGKDGAIHTIDLGQMYRFFPSDSLDRLYAPNAKKPIFTTMWEAFTQGKIDLNLDKGLQQVAKVDALPDEKFVAMLRPYAEARYQQNAPVPGFKTADEFMAAALKRKQTLHDDMVGFYDSLAKERGLAGLGELLPETAQKVGLKPVQPLHPRVKAQWAQSRANAARYKEETLQVLTEKFGSRAKAEAKYDALYKDVKKKMFIGANYGDGALLSAIREGRVKSVYDFPIKDQLQHKGPGYFVKRNYVDTVLGVKKDNPLYVSIGGNKKFADDVAKYGNVTMQYKEADLAARTLFSDGNHFNYAMRNGKPLLKPREKFAQGQFTYFDAPHLVINRLVKEGLDPKEQSRLIEGMVFGGLNPAKVGEAVKVVKNGPQVAELLEAAKQAGLKVGR